MGLEVTTLNIADIQKRYMSLTIRKGDGVGEAAIGVETGYYSDNVNKKGWVKIIAEEIHLYNDLLNILVNNNQVKLGIPLNAATGPVGVGVVLETLIYAIIAGKIPITSDITIRLMESDGKPVEGKVELSYKGELIYQSPSEFSSMRFSFLPVMLGVNIVANAVGYTTSLKSVGSWYGVRTVDIVMTPAPIVEQTA